MQTKQDEKLDEVRAILQRLQRISTGTDDDQAADRAAASPAPAEGTGEPAPQAPPRPLPVKPASIAIVAAAVLLLIGVAGLALWPGRKPPPAIDAAPRTAPATTAAIAEPPPPIAALAIPTSPLAMPAQDAERLAAAQSLMDGGKVAEARQLLLGDFAERSADAALLLARSYDPNALQHIARPNAPADADEAERWYRRWSMIAGREGLALDEDRLDRIIRSMR